MFRLWRFGARGEVKAMEIPGENRRETAGAEPRGELSLRTIAMPADTNPAGDIFGGHIMSLMDLAAGMAARAYSDGRVVTAAVSNLSFLQPVKVGDVLVAVDQDGRPRPVPSVIPPN